MRKVGDIYPRLKTVRLEVIILGTELPSKEETEVGRKKRTKYTSKSEY
jgi:hypothetical protein